MINKNDLRKAISSIAISNAKRNTIYKAFSDLDSITKEEFDSVKSDISKVVESMLTKDTVGKANGVASLDSNGSVPIEQLGNVDTTLFLIVRELPTADIKSNKIYLVPNEDGQGNNVYIEYLYVENVWEKVGEFKPEVDLSHIEEKLDTKADKTDVDNCLSDLQNYCFKFGNDGSVAAPYKGIPDDDSKIKIRTFNNIEEYTYAGFGNYLEPGDTDYIYDKTLDRNIKITTSDNYISTNREGDFFRTSEPLNLTHTFYLDNEKTGVIENLTQLTIEENNVFVNFPYVEINDNIEDSEAPQYIYDTTDNKWIEVVETFYTASYVGLNTEEPLDLTHEFYIGIIGNWSITGEHSTALGSYAYSGGIDSTALGCFTTVNGNSSTCVGFDLRADGNESIVLGYKSSSQVSYNVVLGRDIKAQTGADNSIAIGSGLTVSGNHAIAIGDGIDLSSDYSIAIGDIMDASAGAIAIGNNNHAKGDDSIAIGYNTWSADNYSIGIGYRAKASGLNSLALGATSTTGEKYAISIGNAAKAIGHHSIAIGNHAESNFKGCLCIGSSATCGRNYAIVLGTAASNTKAIFSVGFDGTNGIEMDGDNYGLYLKGFGGYDGENLILADKENQTETLNPDIKSVQQIINEKADASAIPTKTSQLINDSNFITSYTEIDPVWTSEKGNYYTKTEIDGKGYLTAHQSLDNCVKIGNDTTPTQLFKGQGSATINAKQLLLNSPSGGVNIQPDSINIGSSSFTFKANPTEGLGFIVNTASKGVILTPQGGVNSIGFNAKDAIVQKGGSLVGQDVAGAVYNVNGNFVNLNPLYNLESKFRDTIAIHVALDNITDASTPEEVVTKFNQLLKSLKAIGLMKPDATAE